MISDFFSLGLTGLIVFCRVGACLLVVPAVASSRVPVPARLYIALSLAAIMAPSVGLQEKFSFSDIANLTIVILSESLVGLLFGLSVRFFFLALEIIGELISLCIGLSNNLGVPVEGMDPSPIIASFLSVAALGLFFSIDLHHKVIGGIFDSYSLIPLGSVFSISSSLKDIVDLISGAFSVVIKLASPFIFFAIVVNFGFGLMNKIIPQFPSFFMSLPFIVFGGIIILYMTISPGSLLFIYSVRSYVDNL